MAATDTARARVRLRETPPRIPGIRFDALIGRGGMAVVWKAWHEELNQFVADAGLGTINAAVLTAEHLRARKIPLKGFIFNNWQGGIMQEDNRRMVEEMTGAPVLACVPRGAAALPMDAAQLASLYE